ncbi:hypothetical protein FY034_05405 [Trichlorobacter lovleyi]|uniref:hypothetical protein n=1 Tax=Trichlorobacter lovleyi TaxID=313985 RepID=UPI00223EC71F|nr:hypothetical protein [Trichlorobacter lovleyi]QOX78392.1 hypothetical protein FY034_05405 [Trichlorobacter lovleyi]
MKKSIILAAVALMGFAGLAQADEVDLKNYKMAREYIRKEKITVTVTVEQAFKQDAILVVGEGVPKKGTTGGQKRLTALRAAEVAAQRALAELLKGVSITGETTVRDAELESDVIRSSVNTFIKGFHPVVKDWNAEEETALVILRVGINGPGSFAAMMYEKVLTEPKIKQQVEKPVYTPPADVPAPAPVAQAFDGLIIDATAYSFRPALINRIFNPKGEVLYDPAKISQKVLVEQGCGEYTNSVDKARAALRKRGVNNPLVVKASGTVSPSDLQVSNDVALQIFSANQNNGFMADARVAFVLK